MRITVLLFALSLVLLLPEQTRADDCKVLIEHKCSSCHFVTHICPKLSKNKGKWTWNRTIKSMVDHGMTISDEESNTLVKCLVNPDDTVRALCSKTMPASD